MKMTKKETISEIQKIMSGKSGHTMAIITPLTRGYDVYTTVGKICTSEKPYGSAMIFKHCCNSISLAEVTHELEERKKYL